MNPLLGESPSLRADVVGVSLGPPMFGVTGSVRAAVVEIPAGPPVTVVQDGVTVTVHLPPITVRLPMASFEAVVVEVQTLRAELDARSFAGRWRRVVAWVRGLFR
jgi:hypothetical protein